MSVLAEKSTAVPLTYEQYQAEGEINRRYDIIDGVRVWMPNPSVRHQDVLFNIGAAFKNFSRVSGAGRMVVAACDVLITFEPLHTRQPDVLFISHARFGDRDPLDPGALDPAPELVVEVLSPSDTRRVLDDKIRDYCQVNVRECWIVNLALQTVEALRLTPDGPEPAALYSHAETARSLTFSDLTVPVADIFAL